MSYLEYANQFYYLGHIIRGYLAALPPQPWARQWGGEGLLYVPVPSPVEGKAEASAQTSLKRYGLRVSRRSS